MSNVLRRLPGRAVFAVTVLLVCALPISYGALFSRNIAGAACLSVACSLITSLLLALCAVGIIVPIAFGFTLNAYQMAPSSYKRWFVRPLHLAGSIPPIVCAAAILLPVLAVGGRPSAFWAVLALALALLPRSCLMAAGSLRDVPDRYYLCGMSLGATRRNAMMGIVLKLSRRKMLSSALTVFSLALDQLALLHLALGFAPGLVSSSLVPLPSLLLDASKSGDFATAALAALLLLIVSAALSVGSRALAQGDA